VKGVSQKNAETDGEMWLLNGPHEVESINGKNMRTENTEREE
jgi:hypothetical protein